MKVYTKTVCPKCMLLKVNLDSREISYATVNIDHDEEAKQFLVNEGIMTVPVVEYEGKLYTEIPEINALISDIEK